MTIDDRLAKLKEAAALARRLAPTLSDREERDRMLKLADEFEAEVAALERERPSPADDDEKAAGG